MNSVAIDIGTTSISAVVMDAESERIKRSWTIPNPGFLETPYSWERIQSPARIVSEAKKLLDSILSEEQDISVIGLTGQMHGIVYLDRDGKAVSPLITWQDGRGNLPAAGGGSVCNQIAERFHLKAYSGYGLISHLYNVSEGLVPSGAQTVATIMDYFGMTLTGAAAPLLHSSNAASLGLYDLAKNEWRRDILESFGADPAILPRVTDSFETTGSYRGIPVSVAIGDNQASFLGSIRHADEEILVNMGTGGQISLLADKALDAEEIETRPFNEKSYLIVGSSLCGGRAYATLASFFSACGEAFGLADRDPYGMMADLLSKDTGTEPLTVDTSFAGTREHPEKRGSILNIGYENFTPAALTKGVLNGMAQELLTHYETMRAGLGIRRSRIIASGNGMRLNPALQRVTETKFGMGLTLSTQTEEAACGAAVAGLSSIGLKSWKNIVGFRQ